MTEDQAIQIINLLTSLKADLPVLTDKLITGIHIQFAVLIGVLIFSKLWKRG